MAGEHLKNESQRWEEVYVVYIQEVSLFTVAARQPQTRAGFLLCGSNYALEEGMATHSSFLAWRIPMDRGAWPSTVHGIAKRQTQLSDQAQHMVMGRVAETS